MLLHGKRIIVTGGVTGIGKATVLTCAREGAEVVCMSRADPCEERVTQVLDAARNLGPGPIIHMQVDISQQDVVDSVFDEAVAWMGGLDALIHCAGAESTKPAEDLTAQDFHEVLDANVLGTAFTNAAAFRHMKDTGGSIVNYISAASITGQSPNQPAYSASKGGVIGYSRAIAYDWGKYMIRIYVVAPAADTELHQEYMSEKALEKRKQFEAYLASIIPRGGKMPKPNAVADVNVFLASDLSRGMIGQLIAVDGG